MSSGVSPRARTRGASINGRVLLASSPRPWNSPGQLTGMPGGTDHTDSFLRLMLAFAKQLECTGWAPIVWPCILHVAIVQESDTSNIPEDDMV